ncbi:hypothetical protein ASF73_19950 [Xanthomonas sp. Leaf131]|nr:hypothetical protein ASF73_19950 [Xanthomonas sp. Leaf131]
MCCFNVRVAINYHREDQVDALEIVTKDVGLGAMQDFVEECFRWRFRDILDLNDIHPVILDECAIKMLIWAD